MVYARKVVLHLPIVTPDALGPFVEQCLRDRVALIAIVGEDAREIEDLIDELIVGDGSDVSRFIATTEHHDESVDAVTAFAASLGPGEVELVRL